MPSNPGPCRRMSVINSLLARAAKAAGRAEELIDQALYDLDGLYDVSSNPYGKRVALPKAWKSMIEPVTVTLHLYADGRSRISVEGEQPVTLSPRLTALALFAASGAPDEDGILSYRLVSDATNAWVTSTKAIAQLVYRLRRKLCHHGWNPFLLETAGSKTSAKLRLFARKLVIKHL